MSNKIPEGFWIAMRIVAVLLGFVIGCISYVLVYSPSFTNKQAPGGKLAALIITIIGALISRFITQDMGQWGGYLIGLIAGFSSACIVIAVKGT